MTPELHLLLMLRRGPVWDGNLPSKTARDTLLKAHLIWRCSGFQFLSDDGVKTLVGLGFLDEDTWNQWALTAKESGK